MAPSPTPYFRSLTVLPQYEPCKCAKHWRQIYHGYFSGFFSGRPFSQGMMFYFKVYVLVINSSDCLSEVVVWYYVNTENGLGQLGINYSLFYLSVTCSEGCRRVSQRCCTQQSPTICIEKAERLNIFFASPNSRPIRFPCSSRSLKL